MEIIEEGLPEELLAPRRQNWDSNPTEMSEIFSNGSWNFDCHSIKISATASMKSSVHFSMNSLHKSRILRTTYFDTPRFPVQEDYSLIMSEGQPSKNLIAERRRRKRLNDRLSMLRSIVPKISKMDRTSILGDTIDYTKELLERIKSLQKEIADGLNMDHIFKNEILVRNKPKDLEQRTPMSSDDIKQALFRNAGYGGRCLYFGILQANSVWEFEPGDLINQATCQA
ncbi:hypothetical protein V6N13_129810 [Hibiscus sabdariffa]